MAHSVVYNVRVFATVFDSLSLLLTAWRIYFRLKIGRFWWEDAWAVILFFTGLVWVIAQMTFAFTSGLTSLVSSWIYSLGFTCIVTLARMSILFSIIRIIRGRHPHVLKFAYACVVFFAASWTTIIVQKVYQCTSNTSWHHFDAALSPIQPFCAVATEISIFELTTDCIGDSILVALPLRMLWRVKLPGRQRRMILSIFASSTLLAFGALLHIICQVFNVYDVAIAGINVEINLSLCVCNLLVVVTYMYRFFFHNNGASEAIEDSSSVGFDDDDFTTPATQSPVALTTVDLDTPSSSPDTTGDSWSGPSSQREPR